MIVDFDRSIERKAGIGEISLSNIRQVRMIGPDGNVKRASGGVDEALSAAASEGSWNVDPTGMPPELMLTWRQIEFGNFAAAAKALDRISQVRQSERKNAAQVLRDYVDTKMLEQVALAESAAESSDLWRAYRLYEDAKLRFVGYELPASVERECVRLKKEESVQDQIVAMKLWERAQKAIQSGRATPAGMATMLTRIIESHPNTEAAGLAQDALAP